MATKNISITEDAYRRLASFRKGNESFSEIIVTITGKRKLRDFFGILSKESGEALRKAVAEGRKRHAEISEKRKKEIAEAFR